MRLPDLPVREALDDLRRALTSAGSAVLVAPPGAGKTTVVPLALLEEPWLEGGKIVLLEPRRLATRAAASRMADTLGEPVGATVGYRIRGDTQVGPSTRIEVVTEGVLTRMLQSDPSLDGVGAVLFDEFHERSIHADLGLALALASRRLFREDLRILVMSATLQARPVAELLGEAPLVETSGREYPVETRYADSTPDDRTSATAARVRAALGETEGDVLAFLPGVGEIRRVADRLSGSLPEGTDLYPLYGNLSGERQDAAIAPSPEGRRKIVLATAIAQTSLTIEGVRVVVDSGLMRVPRFDPGSGMTGLETLQVTRDVADQRRGRAGRVAPGVCYRLWSRGRDRGLLPSLRPEILEADLAPLLLELAAWGAAPDELDWLDPPPEAALEQAKELLVRLEALDEAGAITGHGRAMAELGAHPRVAHMLVRSRELGAASLACDLAALLGARDILRRAGGPPDADMRLRTELLQAAHARGRRALGAPVGHELRRGATHRILDDAARWRRSLGIGRPDGDRVSAARTGELLALAYPDRVGRRRSAPGSGAVRFRLRNGRGAALPAAESLAGEEWIVASDIDDRPGDARLFRGAPLDRETVERLFSRRIRESAEVEWNADTERVEARRVRRLGALVLDETPLRDPPPAAVGAALLEGIRSAGFGTLPWSRKSRQLRERMQFMHAADPERWPDVSDEALMDSLEDWLAPHLTGADRLSSLRRVDLNQALWGRVGWQRRQELEREAPTHVEVPSGSRIPIDYSDADAPALAVRLQEVFGWTRTPRIGNERVPLTIRLLSPAQRPVQVTRDLESFWESGYFEVKKDLKGRYPKHYWPEDPLTATPTRRVRPRKKD